MHTSLRSRLPFWAAVALVAAAVGDPLVETIANTGALGGGYSDNNHVSVIPTLVAGISLVALMIARRCIELCRGSAPRDWVIDIARRYSAGSPIEDVPFVVLFQFAALFVMEAAEQLVFGGHLTGGTAWLGGPVLFSVTVHAAVGILCCTLITYNARAIVHRFATLVVGALHFILLALDRQSCALFAKRRAESTCRTPQTLHIRLIGERAPPPLLALT